VTQPVPLVQDPAESRRFPAADEPEAAQVMPLISLSDFLMHGVVLQSRYIRPRAGDVSRETFLRKSGRSAAPGRCFT
jgi:hypothetical protein